jgi:hypothetical protein
MKHEMTDEEYSKYLDDMQELEKLRRVKNDFAKNARSYLDDVKDISGKILTITDIASVHYLKKQKVEFMYEFNNSGEYRRIMMSGKQGGQDKCSP